METLVTLGLTIVGIVVVAAMFAAATLAVLGIILACKRIAYWMGL